MLEQIEPRSGLAEPEADGVDHVTSVDPSRPAGASGPASDEWDVDELDLGFGPAGRAAGRPPRHQWERGLLWAVLVADVAAVLLALLLAWTLRGYAADDQRTYFSVGSNHVPYLLLAGLAIPVWLGALAIGGAYDPSLLGDSTDEYSKVVTVAGGLLLAVCAISFLGYIYLSRGLLAIFFPALVLFAVFDRYVVRKTLHHRRRRGLALRKIVVVGEPTAVAHLSEHLERLSYAGYQVIGAYVPGGPGAFGPDVPGLPPVQGEPDQLVGDLDRMEVDAVAVTGHHLFESESLRSLAWRLHGTGVQLMVAPDLVDIAGPRIVSRPAGGLPMLLVEEPRTTGPARMVKGFTERVGAFVIGLLLTPVLLVVAVLVKTTSRGPMLYRQVRVGRDGKPFEMLKFRSMVEDADKRREELLAHNEHHGGPLFKMRRDPRVTRVGRWLRRFSLDELPQLWNVVRGDMAMVGPRPPLPIEVVKYGGDVGRRLMVKPGITGLWQVSGRSELSWTEAVRLDLYYVENWSLSLDVTIMLKTAKTVLSGSGAY